MQLGIGHSQQSTLKVEQGYPVTNNSIIVTLQNGQTNFYELTKIKFANFNDF